MGSTLVQLKPANSPFKGDFNKKIVKIAKQVDSWASVPLVDDITVFNVTRAVSYTHLTLPTNREV